MIVDARFCPSSHLFEVPYGIERNAPPNTVEASPGDEQPLAHGDGSILSEIPVSDQSQFGYMVHHFDGEPYGEGYLVVAQGEQVNVLEVEDQWARVQCHGSQNAPGWVPTNFVRRLSEQDV